LRFSIFEGIRQLSACKGPFLDEPAQRLNRYFFAILEVEGIIRKNEILEVLEIFVV